MKTFLRLFIFSVFGFIAATASAQNTWYLNATQPFGSDWNTLSYWSANPTAPLGGNPGSISNLDTFNSNGFNLRTGYTTGSSTFGGSELVMNNSTLLLKAVTTNIGNLTFSSAVASISNSSAGATDLLNLTINVSQLTLNGEARVVSSLANSRTLDFNVTTLRGASDLVFGKSLNGTITPSTFTFSAINATSYTGDVVLMGSASSLKFSNNLISSGGLVLGTGSIVTLERNLTFTSLTIGGINLAPGTYSYSTLNSTYDAYFANGGSGSITVAAIPEPATAGLLIIAGLILRLRRRSRV